MSSSPARSSSSPSWQLAIAELERVLDEARRIARRAEASLLVAMRDVQPANSETDKPER
jgi:hypothetical protein